jgi:hypothetical protein
LGVIFLAIEWEHSIDPFHHRQRSHLRSDQLLAQRHVVLREIDEASHGEFAHAAEIRLRIGALQNGQTVRRSTGKKQDIETA